MEPIERISDVFIYKVLGENILFTITLSDRKVYIYGLQESPLFVEGKFASLILVGQEMWMFELEEMYTIIGEVIGSLFYSTPLSYAFSPSNPPEYMHGHLVGLLREKGEEKNYGVIDRSKEIVARHDIPFGLNNVWQVLDNETFLSKEDNLLTCHALSDGREIWRIDVGEKGCSQRYDGQIFEGTVLYFFVYKSIIVATLGNYKLLGIDRDTGNIVWEDDRSLYHKSGAAEGKLYLLYHTLPEYRHYVVRDMLTGHVDAISDVSDMDLLAGTFLGNVVVHHNFFIVTRQYEAIIFILHLQTGKTLWTIPMEGRGRMPSDGLSVHGNRIYQLDLDNVLHIFEVNFDSLLK